MFKNLKYEKENFYKKQREVQTNINEAKKDLTHLQNNYEKQKERVDNKFEFIRRK